MTGAVVDASVIGPLLIADERAILHPRLRAILDSGDAVVPLHWHLEVANLGRSAIRRKRADAGELAVSLAVLALLPIIVDAETSDHAWTTTLALSARHDLTPYDAAYLELALRRRLPLVTTDGDLRAAATAERVPLTDA